MKMMKLLGLGAVLTLALPMLACSSTEECLGEVEPAEARVICAATAGGGGGDGGDLELLYGELDMEASIDEALALHGGQGGAGGAASAGEAGSAGQDGQPGELYITRDVDYVFDDTGITAEMLIDVGSEGSSSIFLQDNADPLPVLLLELLQLSPGATLMIGGDARISARHVEISEGARLILRQRNSGGRCTIGVGSGVGEEPGRSGSQLYLKAETLVLDGVLDAGGNPGGEGQAGGHGGNLLLQVERLALGPEARFIVSGGDGGSGVDEQDCGQ